jgi:flagellin-specific chaperone FliS
MENEMQYEYEKNEKTIFYDEASKKGDFFKPEHENNVVLISLTAVLDKSDAVKLYENFDQFIKDCEVQLSYATTSKNPTTMTGVMNLVNEIISYFDIAIKLLPALSGKSGQLIEFLNNFFGGGGGGELLFDWTSYSIQFGMPTGISIAFSFSNET